MVNEIINVFVSVQKAQVVVIGIVFISYIIEKNTDLKFLVENFKWRKSPKNVVVFADGDSGYYIVVCAVVFIYDIIKGNVIFNFISVMSWILIMVIITPTLYYLHKKYQGVDPNKADDDYT